MKSKQNQIRVIGQRSIPSSFFSRSSSNLGKDSNDDVQNKNSSISFSDFLDQKLHTNHQLNKIVKGKSMPFKSPLGSRDHSAGSIDHLIGIRKEVEKEKEKNTVIDQVVFEQFKPSNAEKVDDDLGSGEVDVEHGTSSTGTSVGLGSSLVGEIGSSNSNNNEHVTRKRRNPFEDGDKHTTRKHLLALGDDPQPRQRARRKRSLSNKNPKSSFNHYGNGSGWWDCDMEGVDAEEVGLGDVWEGVGSTTFGVIDWH